MAPARPRRFDGRFVFRPIRRVPNNGRLDQQRYGYVRWRPNPLDEFKLFAEEAYTELVRRYFVWIGPASVAEFQWFSGLGAKPAKAAIEPLELVPLESGSDRLMHRADRDKLEALKIPKEHQYVLLGSLTA